MENRIHADDLFYKSSYYIYLRDSWLNYVKDSNKVSNETKEQFEIILRTKKNDRNLITSKKILRLLHNTIDLNIPEDLSIWLSEEI